MRGLVTVIIFLAFYVSTDAATFRNYIGFERINSTTVRIWVESDTQFGESVHAQIKYGNPETFSGFVEGSFDSGTFGSANWRVDITIPETVNSVEIELANENQSGSLYGFTGFAFSESNLPVELAYFTATKESNVVVLNWSTLSEENNAGFDIEQSVDGKDFEVIGRVEGEGNAVEKVDYSFVDENPANGINYYRLKQVDFDGAFEYSKIVSVEVEGEVKVSIFPNPTTDKLTINGDIQEVVNILVFNATGQVVYENTVRVDNQKEVDFSDLPAGNYFFVLRNDTTEKAIYSGNFVKK